MVFSKQVYPNETIHFQAVINKDSSQYTDGLILGDHLRQRRIEANMGQHELAEVLGVSKAGISDWEIGRKFPNPKNLQKIILFLKYDPRRTEGDHTKQILKLGDHLYIRRMQKGMTGIETAKFFGISSTSYHRWETNKRYADSRHIDRIIEYIGYGPHPLIEKKELIVKKRSFESQMLSVLKNTMGQHLYERRIELSLAQWQVAKMIDADRTAIGKWEQDILYPSDKYIQRIREFLGYEPQMNINKAMLDGRNKRKRIHRANERESNQ